VQLAHAAVGAPAVDVWVRGAAEPLVADLGYGVATGYFVLDVPTAPITIDVYPGDTPEADVIAGTATPVESLADFAPTMGSSWMVVAGTPSDPGDSVAPLIALSEGWSAPPSASDALVRIVHAADAPTVGVDVYDPETEAACEGTIEEPALAAKTATSDAGVAVPGGRSVYVALCVPAAGGGGGNTVVTTFTAQLAAGDTAYVIASGLANQVRAREADALRLLVADGAPTAVAGAMGDIAQDPVLWVLRGQNRGGTNDVCVDRGSGPELIEAWEDLRYGGLGAGQRVPADAVLALSLHIDENGGGDCQTGGMFGPYDLGELDLGDPTTGIARGDAALLLITGDSNENNPAGPDYIHFDVVVEDTAAPATGTSRMIFAHGGAIGVPEVDAGAQELSAADLGTFVDVPTYGRSGPGGESVNPSDSGVGPARQYRLLVAPSTEAGLDAGSTPRVAFAGLVIPGDARLIGAIHGPVNPNSPDWRALRFDLLDVSGGDLAWEKAIDQIAGQAPTP
jgi:hypothetical protein